MSVLWLRNYAYINATLFSGAVATNADYHPLVAVAVYDIASYSGTVPPDSQPTAIISQGIGVPPKRHIPLHRGV